MNQIGVIDELSIEIKSMKKILVNKISTNVTNNARNEIENVTKSIPSWQRSLPITDTENNDSINTNNQNKISFSSDIVDQNKKTSSISNITVSNSPTVEEIDDNLTDKDSHDSIEHQSVISSKPHIPAWQLNGLPMKDMSNRISNVSTGLDSPDIEEIADTL
jgi:hypothetical protein